MIIKAQKQQTKSMNSSMVDFKSTVARRRRYSTVVAAVHNVVKSFLNCNAYFQVFSQHISQLGIRINTILACKMVQNQKGFHPIVCRRRISGMAD